MNQGHARIRKGIGLLAILLLVPLYVTGCLGTETARVTPTPTKTPRPAGTEAVLVPTATTTPEPSPTPTQEPTLAPTDTPTPEPTATITPTLSVTVWPTLSPDACPLTGLPVSDLGLLNRRPLAIKVQNATLSRPQFGLPQADIVFEHLAEAGITRFTAIYLCQPVDKIGSVRSARFIDLEIPAMYKSLMAFSGVSPGLFPMFRDADFKDREFWYDRGIHSAGFYRDKDLRAKGVPIEHTLFADPAKIWEIADELGINQPQDLKGLDFANEVPAGGQPATRINIPYPSRDMIVEYRYDSAKGAYLRWDGGEPHIDAATGDQIAVANVIVLYANHIDADFYEDFPRTNHPSIRIQFFGIGSAVIFRDGQAFEGLWARPKRDDMVVFRDPKGQVPIPLKPGNSWMQMVPLEGHRFSFEATWGNEG